MALHERFNEYTEEEILKIKKKNCIKHACPYFGAVIGLSKKNKANPNCLYNKSCNYILLAGHTRGCMPDECTHWKDENVPKRSMI